MTKWELEDELRAIEELLSQDRLINVKGKRILIETDFLGRGGSSSPKKAARGRKGK